VVIGDGDPNMSGRFFDGDANLVLRAVARDLKQEGLTAVPGGIILDATRFDDQFVHPDWPADQLDRWYSAPVGALVYNDSCWDFKVRPASVPGGRVAVELEPSLIKPPLAVRCSTVARGARHGVRVLHDGEGGLVVQGSVIAGSAGEGGHLAVQDPVLFFGRALRAALIAEGIPVQGAVRRGGVEKPKELLLYRSTLQRTLGVMLGNSQNLYAECLFKRAGGGSFASASETLRATLKELKVPAGGLIARDGSGLSSQNRVAPATLYGVLQSLRDQPLFVQALASGGSGTLRRRYKGLGERIRAKTGTIRGVSTLSGYVEGARGNRYVFVVLANGRSVRQARRLQDLIVQTLARAVDGNRPRRSRAARVKFSSTSTGASTAWMRSARRVCGAISSAKPTLPPRNTCSITSLPKTTCSARRAASARPGPHASGIWAVSVALIEKGKLAAACVHAPALDLTFVAALGEGAYCNGQRAEVSITDTIAESILATGFAYRRNELPDHNFDNFERLGMQAAGVRRMGAAAVDLAFLATGRIDGFWELHLSAWDVAAGILLIREAGGKVTDFRGGEELEQLLYGRNLVASNGRIHDALRTGLQPLRGF